ncbi:hypothetical protein [Myxosarcina sp. GI1(2024)]
MTLPEDRFDIDQPLQNFQSSTSQQNHSSEPKISSLENYKAHKKQLEGLFKKLIIGGLIGGLILGLGMTVLLKKLGLTEKPEGLETSPKPGTEQIEFLPEIN